MKPETPGALAQLTAANIRSVMVTGDNALTAASVAKECGILGPTDVLLVARVRMSETGVYSLVFESDAPLGMRVNTNCEFMTVYIAYKWCEILFSWVVSMTATL